MESMLLVQVEQYFKSVMAYLNLSYTKVLCEDDGIDNVVLDCYSKIEGVQFHEVLCNHKTVAWSIAISYTQLSATEESTEQWLQAERY